MAGTIILYIFLTIAVLLIARGIYETRVLDITHTKIGSGNKSIKVLLLSDIHAQYYFIHGNRLLNVLRTEDLSAVLFAGDLVNGERDMAKGLRILSEVVQEASALRIPVYAVAGNHDPADIGVRLESIGIRYLGNQSEYLEAADGSFWRITGLEDFRIGKPSYAAAADEQSAPEIVLAHNPETIFRIIEDRKQPNAPTDGSQSGKPSQTLFLLSGHFHGGQIWMPFGIEYSIMRHETMAKDGYRKGYYERFGIKGYISRGLGCVLIPLRFLSYPEAALLEIHAD
ncbi:MAG: metallophosphoesterase [Saccharofermentanales bacterium]